MESQAVIFQFDDVQVDVRDAQVLKAGRRLAVEPKAFRVLVFLLERPGRLIEKDELLAAVWAETFVTENALTRSIALLRKALGETKGEAKYIETVPTRGYRFIAPVTVQAAPARETAPMAANMPANVQSREPTNWKRGALWLALIFAVAAAAATVALTFRLRRTEVNAGHKTEFVPLQATNSTALDIFPSFSPDGNTIAYCSTENGSLEIYLKQLTRGGSVVQLTNDGARNTQPAWSPDGSTIAYYSAGRGGIWLIPALGGVARQLTTFGSSPAWSPDGTQITFVSEGSTNLAVNASTSISAATLWLANVKDGTTHQLTQADKPEGAHNAPAWSPDGKSIAFVTAGFKSTGLWTISLADGRLTKIADGTFHDPVFAKDGQHIYISTEFAVWRASLNEPQDEKGLPEHEKIVESLPETSRYLAISADGRKIAFSRMISSSNIYLLPMSGDHPAGPPVALTHDTRLRKTNPVISSDGRRVLFEVGSVDRNGGVWVMDSDGKNSRPVLVPCESPRWLPGNEDFLCTEFVEDPDHHCKEAKCWTADIIKVHLATGTRERVRRLDMDGAFFTFSRDGKQVAFMSEQNGPPNTWVAAVNGGPPRQITFDPLSMGFPSWSPDGKYLAVEQKVGDGTHVWLVKPGETPVQLTHGREQDWPASFSPDGGKVALAAQRDAVWNLWWVSRRDGSQKQLTFYRNVNEYVRYPDWSPAGSAIVYEYAEITGNIWVLELK